ncbi:MAG: hypothetical protein KAH57_10010, partial [Thermoplasmata archaeon]|nr:hypothetical protein [Thermoplasmata archaeon]
MRGVARFTSSSCVIILIMLILISSWSMVDDQGASGSRTDGGSDTRVVALSNEYGAIWYDDFSDQSGISSMSNTMVINEQVQFGEVVFSEDFESYTNGVDLVGSNGWTHHINNNEGTFVCDTSGPYSSNTPQVGYHFNDQQYSISSFLSGTFLLTQGTYELWAMTSQLDSTYTTTSMNLVAESGDYPKAEDRILDVAFSRGGFGCRGSTGSWDMLNMNINVNTWYRISVDFDCTTQLCNVFLYSASGVLLGSELDVGFQFPQTSAKRLMLNSNTRGFYTRSYWDDIRIMDRSGSGSLISNEIDLPIDKQWSTLRIDKEEPGSSWIELEVLDGSDEGIEYFSYDANASEIDISGLNGLGVKTIKLKAILNSPHTSIPILNGWGVEWKESEVWSDMFLTTLKTGSMTNTQVNDMSVGLVDQGAVGYVESIPISVPSGNLWYGLYSDSTYVYPSSIRIDILDPLTKDAIEGYRDITKGEVDISGLDPVVHPSIILRVKIRNNSLTKVSFNTWAVDWIPNEPPIVLGLD